MSAIRTYQVMASLLEFHLPPVEAAVVSQARREFQKCPEDQISTRQHLRRGFFLGARQLRQVAEGRVASFGLGWECSTIGGGRHRVCGRKPGRKQGYSRFAHCRWIRDPCEIERRKIDVDGREGGPEVGGEEIGRVALDAGCREYLSSGNTGDVGSRKVI